MPDDLTEYLRKNPSHLLLRARVPDDLPEHLQRTVMLTRRAFPNGLPMEDYFPLLCLFRQQGWSFRGIATAMQTCFDIDFTRALHDAYGTDAPEIPFAAVERLRQELLPHGLETLE